MEIFIDNCKLLSSKHTHTRAKWTFHCFDRWIGPRWRGQGGRGRAHYRLEFLESRPRNINRYWRVGRGLIVNVSTMIRVAKSREGLDVVEMVAARPIGISDPSFVIEVFKWVLSVLDKESLILFFFFFMISRFVSLYFEICIAVKWNFFSL